MTGTRKRDCMWCGRRFISTFNGEKYCCRKCSRNAKEATRHE